MNLINKKQIALLLAISSISGVVAPTILNLKEINSYAYTNEYNLSEKEKQEYGIKKIIIGNNHSTFFLKNDGSVWACGENDFGQLGVGNTTNQKTPVKVDINNVKEVICGAYSNNMFLKEDGTVWACGNNGYGQLGIGNYTNQDIPVQVKITDVKKVFGGNQNNMFLKEDGTVWACGNDSYGQLGIKNSFSNVPVESNITDVKDIGLGDDFAMYLKNNGEVWGCGHNNIGQLGNSNKIDQKVPVHISSNVKKILVNSSRTILLKENGTVYGFGENNHGQLGIGTTVNQSYITKLNITNVKDIDGSYTHTMFIKEDGTVWATGQNDYGQFGNGNKTDQNKPVQVNITDVEYLVAGRSYTMFIKNDGTIWACGLNQYGQLGVENGKNQYTLIELNSPILIIEDLVLKAENSKLQTDLEIAKEKVNLLDEGELKTNLLERLDMLQIEITNITKANELLEELEQNKDKNSITKVQSAINLITDTNIKKQLQDKLNIIKNDIYASDINYYKILQNASDKLEKAESSKSNIDITFTQLAIDKLNPEDKVQLQEQLNNLKAQIKLEKEIEDYNRLLEDAEIKVIKAESSKKDYDITVAQLSINKLKSQDQLQFQNRLDELVYTLLLEEANLKVINAEDLRTDNSISIAQIAVDKVPYKEIEKDIELLGKPILQSKLDNLKLSIEEEKYLKLLEDANLKVTNAEETKTLKDIKLAQMSIDRLKEIDKTPLQERLNALNQLLKDEEKEKNNILIATTKVEQAEKMDNTKYLEDAKELVELLKPSDEKNLLLDRITAIENSTTKTDEKTKTLIYQADVYVKQAEALKRESYIIKAQAGIDKIPDDNPDKALLQDRLNKVNVKK